MGERSGQECDIGFLYAEPIKKDVIKAPSNLPSPQPVSYEI